MNENRGFAEFVLSELDKQEEFDRSSIAGSSGSLLSDKCREMLASFLNTINMRGFLTILGVRKTSGSMDCFLPNKQQLINCFNELNTSFNPDLSEKVGEDGKKKPKKGNPSILTVGGKALCKHAHRSIEV